MRSGQILGVRELCIAGVQINARPRRAHERAADAAGRKGAYSGKRAVGDSGLIFNVLVLLRGIERLHSLAVTQLRRSVAFGVRPPSARIARVQRIHALCD